VEPIFGPLILLVFFVLRTKFISSPPVGVEPISSAVMVFMMVCPAALRLGFDHALTILSNNPGRFLSAFHSIR